MCTLTFVPAKNGYIAGMNRDELLTRPPALPPRILVRDGVEAVYPRESSGGTWIAANSHGNLLALLNWNAVDASSLGQKSRSRGIVIPELISEANFGTTDSRFEQSSFDGLFPFRLLGVFRKERILHEWRWNGVHTEKRAFPWARKHWFSSSLSDSSAEKVRGSTCEAAASAPTSGSKVWLRRLHRSHVPSPGPFSICVHRPDAATMSYTEVRCSGPLIAMDYIEGNPCQKEGFDELVSVAVRELQSPRIAV